MWFGHAIYSNSCCVGEPYGALVASETFDTDQHLYAVYTMAFEEILNLAKEWTMFNEGGSYLGQFPALRPQQLGYQPQILL